jgi:hypothetical protein
MEKFTFGRLEKQEVIYYGGSGKTHKHTITTILKSNPVFQGPCPHNFLNRTAPN